MTTDANNKRREQILNDYRSVLSTDAGKRLLWRLLMSSEFYKAGFDSDKLGYYDGARALGAIIHKDIIEASGAFSIFDKMRSLDEQQINILGVIHESD